MFIFPENHIIYRISLKYNYLDLDLVADNLCILIQLLFKAFKY